MSEGDESAEAPVVCLCPELDEEQVKELGEALGRPVRSLSPSGLDLDELVAQASALVVSWDLGDQPGVDLVESVRRRADAGALPIVLTSPQPTRARVIAALRAGATSFARQPYDPDELKARLESAGADELEG